MKNGDEMRSSLTVFLSLAVIFCLFATTVSSVTVEEDITTYDSQGGESCDKPVWNEGDTHAMGFEQELTPVFDDLIGEIMEELDDDDSVDYLNDEFEDEFGEPLDLSFEQPDVGGNWGCTRYTPSNPRTPL